MAEAGEELEQSEDSAADITAASEIGWTPKDKFRGDAAKWVDAKTFLEKGQLVMPILRKKNQELMSEVQQLRANDSARDTELKAIRAALKAVEEAQDEDLLERVADTKADLEEQIALASEAGDHKRIGKLTGDLAELIAAEKIKASKPAKAVEETPPAKQLAPEYLEWQGQNTDWLGKDQEKTDMAIAFGQAIARTGLRGKPFYAELDKRLDKYYAEPTSSRAVDSKVADGKSVTAGDGGEGSPKGFSDLPKDAKETCDRLAKKMVGPDKPHKDVKSWRASYTRQYLQQESA